MANACFRFLCGLVAIGFSLSAVAESAVYRGTVGTSSGLLVTVDRGADKTGWVRYDASGAEGLTVAIAEKTDGAFFVWSEKLDARDGSSRLTGTFTGRLSSDGKQADGQWRSADGKKIQPFKLDRVATLAEAKSADGAVTIGYPRFDDASFAKLNDRLAAEARQQLADGTVWVAGIRKELQSIREAPVSPERLAAITRGHACDVESVGPRRVSLLCMDYEYAGGAHPNTEFSTLNFHLAGDGTPRVLGIWDILQQKPGSMDAVSKALIDDLKRQKASFVRDGSIKDFHKELTQGALPYLIVPAGLAFKFSPYAVGPYVEGDFRVVIPNRALAPYFRRDGPLADRAERH
jgi:hypothetical protein